MTLAASFLGGTFGARLELVLKLVELVFCIKASSFAPKMVSFAQKLPVKGIKRAPFHQKCRARAV